MVAPRKYPEEMWERAIRLVRDAKAERSSGKGACERIGKLFTTGAWLPPAATPG